MDKISGTRPGPGPKPIDTECSRSEENKTSNLVLKCRVERWQKCLKSLDSLIILLFFCGCY